MGKWVWFKVGYTQKENGSLEKLKPWPTFAVSMAILDPWMGSCTSPKFERVQRPLPYITLPLDRPNVLIKKMMECHANQRECHAKLLEKTDSRLFSANYCSFNHSPSSHQGIKVSTGDHPRPSQTYPLAISRMENHKLFKIGFFNA
jgi:hypothetical protein